MKKKLLALPLSTSRHVENPYTQIIYCIPNQLWQQSGEQVYQQIKAALYGQIQTLPESTKPWVKTSIFQVMESAEFERLAHVTQGFISETEENEKKLHHILELTRIATHVTQELNLDSQLMMLLVILHDSGHSVFAHLGEKKNKYFPEAGYTHDYKHSEQSMVIANNLLNNTISPTDLTALNAGIRNHGGKDNRVDLPSTHYGTPEGVVLMFCDEISRLGTDIRAGLLKGLFTIEDLIQQVPEIKSLIPNIAALESNQLGDTIVAHFVNDLIANSNSRTTLQLSVPMGTLKENLDEFLMKNFFKKNQMETYKAALVQVLQGMTETQQIEFLRTSRDDEVLSLFHARGLIP